MRILRKPKKITPRVISILLLATLLLVTPTVRAQSTPSINSDRLQQHIEAMGAIG
jgi:hypothetical protein